MSFGVGPYDPCPCGSGEKFKFCCGKKSKKVKYPAQPTAEQAFQIALQHHQAGRFPLAEQLYRQILAQQPNHADAWHHLGVVAAQTGRYDMAVELIGRAITIRPNFPEAHSNLGNALKDKGQIDEAIAAYRRAIALRPNYADAHHNLGSALRDKGQIDEAIAAYRRAIALNPSYAEAYSNLGVALKDKGLLSEAVAACRQAIVLRPGYPEAHRNLGNALKDKGQLDDAITAYHRAIALNPNYAQAYSSLGVALKEKGQLDEAIAAYRRAVAFDSSDPLSHSNLGVALKDKGQLDEAIAAYHQAIALKSDVPEAHWNLALALLARGNLPQGFDEYEWRWKCKDLTAIRRDFPQPQWDGRPLAGATLLLYAEQGFGDSIQFIRYLPLVEQRGAKIIIECQEELQRLVQAMAGDSPVIARGRPLPAFDTHCLLMSLPRVFGTALESIPRKVPYVHADVEAATKWRDRLATDADSIKAGLAWAGKKTHTNDRNRSLALSAFASLGQLQGVSFFSLQKGEQAEQARNPPAGLKLIDWTEDLHDFADTAALIANLDLVITVDTAVAHLAGAMGKPVWVLLPFVPDWRWLLGREDSPWYPTMRLFRQSSFGDWDSVIRQVTEALTALPIAHR